MDPPMAPRATPVQVPCRSAREPALYGTIMTVGYMLSRGLAKADSRDPY